MALDHTAYKFAGNAYRHDRKELNDWTRQRREPALEPDLPIIDPHHHLWERKRSRYLIDELLEDTGTGHNIIATVYMECGAMYRAEGPEELKPVGEVEFVNGVAAMSASGGYGKSRLCSAIIGHADLCLGQGVVPVLEALAAAGNGRFRGIRHGVTWDTGEAARYNRKPVPRHQMLDPVFQRGFACLAPMGLSFEAWQFHPQLADVVGLMRAAPETNVIVNHCGGVLGLPPHDGNRDEVFRIWRKSMSELVQFPNLTVKVGGLGMLYTDWDFHRRDIPPTSEELANAWRPYVEACIELFGVHRCMLESNFPVDKQSCGYGELWNAFKRITRDYSVAEKAALYRDTAARVYRMTY